MGRKYAAKVDANQPQIVKDLRAIYGPWAVCDLSRVGGGVPDLLLGVRGQNLFVELKTDKGELTADQEEFHRHWRGQIAVVRTIEDALQVIERGTL